METVLVVDDERFFLTILGDFVQQVGMRPLLSQDGTTALGLLEREPVDLVLLDIVMPGVDGLEILRRIKERRPSLPVVMLALSFLMISRVQYSHFTKFKLGRPKSLQSLTIVLGGLLLGVVLLAWMILFYVWVRTRFFRSPLGAAHTGARTSTPPFKV